MQVHLTLHAVKDDHMMTREAEKGDPSYMS